MLNIVQNYHVGKINPKMSNSTNNINNTVVVSNLSFNVAEGHLKEIFETYGKVEDVKLAKNKFGHSLQWALITYETTEMVEEAINYLNGGQIDGLTITVRKPDPNIDIL